MSGVARALKPYIDKIHLIDVGARDGLHPRWKNLRPLITVVGFEPDAEECDKLNAERPGDRCLPYALGERRERRRLYLCRHNGCSSLYRPNAEFVDQFWFGPAMEVVGETEVSVAPLDEIAEREKLSADYLKVDTQGAELEILRGGIATLFRTLMVEVEVEFNPQYIDQPLFADVDHFMREHGFTLLALRRSYWRRSSHFALARWSLGGHPIHGDALYYNGRLLASSAAEGVLKFLALLWAYDQHDIILQLLETHEGLRSIDAVSRRALAATLVSRPVLATRLAWDLTKMFPRFRSRFSRTTDGTDWHDREFF